MGQQVDILQLKFAVVFSSFSSSFPPMSVRTMCFVFEHCVVDSHTLRHVAHCLGLKIFSFKFIIDKQAIQAKFNSKLVPSRSDKATTETTNKYCICGGSKVVNGLFSFVVARSIRSCIEICGQRDGNEIAKECSCCFCYAS